MKNASEFLVLNEHTDELGHLNHVSAIKYLELARDIWYGECGLWGGRPWSEDEPLGTIVLNVNINYRQECFEGEVLVVTTLPKDMGSKSFTLKHEIIKPDGVLAIDGEVTSLIMDMNQKITLPVPYSLARYLTKRAQT
jgi:thioesterase-3